MDPVEMAALDKKLELFYGNKNKFDQTIKNDAEEIYQRLCRKKSVVGVMVFSENSVRSSLDGIGTTEVSSAVFPLVDTARRTVKDLDPTDELLFLRIRTRRDEIIVGTEESNVYVVLQDARFIRTPLIPK